MIRKSQSSLSIVDKCKCLDLNRSTYYRSEQATESPLNLELMSLIDKHYLQHPYKGSPRMYVYLTKDLGYPISKNRVDRLYYKVMGLRAMIPGPHTSKRRKNHPVYPYLLRDLKIDKANQVWATDITYIGLEHGYMYLIAYIDLYSRYVLAWDISNTMTAQWCAELLNKAVDQHGKPEIVNTDQGSQFTSQEFTSSVIDKGIRLSMDGKGRATDNAFIERLWRSVKYEKIYLHLPRNPTELYQILDQYFNYYNHQRRHSSIDDQRPSELYFENSVLRSEPSLQHSNAIEKNLLGDFFGVEILKTLDQKVNLT